MSGGHFEYANERLMIEMFGYDYDTKEIKNDPFEDREISELMYDLLELTYSLDYYLSGDISKEDYLNDKKKFKEKWFGGNREERLKKYIDEQLDLIKQELLEMI